jgi:hypothetical protein
MKVYYHEWYSELDKQFEFAVYCDDPIWHVWVFYGIGREFEKANIYHIYLLPYKPHSQKDKKPLKIYTYNGATKVGSWIAKRIIKRITKQ